MSNEQGAGATRNSIYSDSGSDAHQVNGGSNNSLGYQGLNKNWTFIYNSTIGQLLINDVIVSQITPVGDITNNQSPFIEPWGSSVFRLSAVEWGYIGNFTPLSTATTQQIQMLNRYDNSTINVFQVTAYNLSNTYYYNTTNGTAYFANLSGSFTFNVTIPNYYENIKSFTTSISGSQTIQNYSIQSLFNVSVKELISNNSLTNFNATLTNYYNSTTGQSLLLITNNASQSITLNKVGYISTSTSQAATTGQITNVEFFIGTTFLNITVKEFLSNDLISNYNLTLTSLNYTYTTFRPTTNGTVDFLVINGSYNVFIDAENYSYTNKTINVTGLAVQNEIIYLYETNSFFINFYDEITGAKVVNVTLQVISDIFAASYNTTNGSIYVFTLLPTDYTFRYSSSPLSNVYYPQREYFATLTNRQSYNLSLYLIRNSSSSLISTLIYDQNNNFVEGATVKILRYDINTNSYILVAEGSSDVNGINYFNLQAYGEYYKFIVEYQGVQYFESNPTQITTSQYIFQIILTDVIGTQESTAWNTNLNLSVIQPNIFRFYFNDVSNEITQGCLYVYEGVELINSSCGSGNTGILYISVDQVNGTTYKANAFIYKGNVYTYVDTKYITFASTLEDEIGSDSFFWLFLVTLLLVFLFALNAVLAMVALPIPLILFNLFGLINFPWHSVIFISFASWAIAFIIEEKQ